MPTEGYVSISGAGVTYANYGYPTTVTSDNLLLGKGMS
jgi:hypothetical protein